MLGETVDIFDEEDAGMLSVVWNGSVYGIRWHGPQYPEHNPRVKFALAGCLPPPD